MQDEYIVELFWLRDETALTQTAQKYGSYLQKIAFQILSDREDSEESVNDTYLKAWHSMPPHKPCVLSSYLGKITRQLSIDRFRQKNRQKRKPSQYALSLSELEECIPGGSSPEEALELQLLARSITAFLRCLPPKTRQIFIGRYYYLDPVKEIAAYCGISEAKTKSLLHRTRIRLRAHLEKEGFHL